MKWSFSATRRKGKRKPKAVGGRIDFAKLLDLDIKDAEHVVAEMKTALEEEKLEIRHDLEAAKLDSGKGSKALGIIKHTTIPTLDDYDKLLTWIKKHDAFDLLQRRLSSTAYRDRAADGQVIPGVGTFTKTTLELRVRRDGSDTRP